jgi:hypothetical protein
MTSVSMKRVQKINVTVDNFFPGEREYFAFAMFLK